MADWITEKSRIEQSNTANDWYLLDNELFLDDDSNIYLVPRGFKTDNYTIPDWVAWVGGSKSKWDVRPSHIHDFACKYHKLLKIRVSYLTLMKLGYVQRIKDKIICFDIPPQYLTLMDINKWDTDCLFKRAMKATKTIPARIYNTFRCGVFFNVGWLAKVPEYNFDNIYKKEKI